MANIVHATQPSEIAAVGALFAEYARAVDAPCCFVGLESELATLPGEYAPPAGRLLLALDALSSAGCVALWPLDAEPSAIKRLYVRSAGQSPPLASTSGRHAAISCAGVSSSNHVTASTIDNAAMTASRSSSALIGRSPGLPRRLAEASLFSATSNAAPSARARAR